jgi:hypothetical protein
MCGLKFEKKVTDYKKNVGKRQLLNPPYIFLRQIL